MKVITKHYCYSGHGHFKPEDSKEKVHGGVLPDDCAEDLDNDDDMTSKMQKGVARGGQTRPKPTGLHGRYA